jgi:4-diphosphocytidyl-2-C-methyl-D-erythritol kinase
VTVRRAAAPAKVNLTLAVSGRRPDGYHDLSTILVRIGLADRLTARPTSASPTLADDADRLDAVGLPAGPVADNLVLRAAAALRRHLARPLPPLEFGLEKVVPVAAGLGGGSSDAAAAVGVAARAWGVTLDRASRLTLAETVGSDVPFFALGAAAVWATGRGERLAALPAPAGAPACVLAVARDGVATAAVFEAFDRLPPRRGAAWERAAAATERLAGGLRAGLPAAELVGGAAELRDANDLWAALVALRPDLERLRASLESRSGRPWLLSGSGPTLFALYASLAEAREAVKELGSGPAGRRDGVRLIAAGLGATHRRPIDTGGTA